jgi:4'-phosphopantetheinyl transferase
MQAAPYDRSIQLGSDEVQVWAVWLAAPETILTQYWDDLSEEEQNRAGRFRFDDLKRRYILSRGALRALLGYYTGRPRKDVALSYGPKGKPFLPDHAKLQFNTSHSADLALYAFTYGSELGVDIEQIRPLAGLESVASRFFSTREISDLLSLPPESRMPAFFRCWTRKEAYIKAIGDGLSMNLDAFQVTLLPQDPPRLASAKNTQDDWAWILHHLDPAPGYVGALAYEGEPRSIIVRPPMEQEQLLILTS